MIKVNEIRKGNLLSFYKPLLHEPQQLTVKGWYHNDDDGLWYIQSDEYVDINEAGLMPIPLTPEWLGRCGKRLIDNQGWEYQIPVGALKWYFRWNTKWYSELGGIYIDSKVQYVHQLQNLYFALTGEDLKLKVQ